MKYCSEGGFIRGKEMVKGNSPLNDTVELPTTIGGKIKVSPGEVIVDKETLAGGPHAWVDFIGKEVDQHKNSHDAENKEVKSMAEGGMIDNSISPDNALNQYVPQQGIVGGTVFDGSTDERFLFGDYCFDIDKAREISKKQSNMEIQCSPKWIDKIKLNPKDALESNSENPVFIAQIHTPNGMKPLLIDGNHRMFKAIWEGKKSIPAFCFTPEQTTSLFCAKPMNINHPKYGSVNKKYCGGGTTPGYQSGGYVNPNYQGVQNYFNPQGDPDASASAASPKVSTPDADRIRQLETVQQYYKKLSPSQQGELDNLRAKRQQPSAPAQPTQSDGTSNFYDGGTFGWDATPPTAAELGTNKPSWDSEPPTKDELKAPPGVGEKIGRGALHLLPTIGAIGGGVAALPLAPETLGAAPVAGAALGATMGNELERAGRKYFYGDNLTEGAEHLKEDIGAAGSGALMEVGGQALGKVPGAVSAGAKKLMGFAGEKMGMNTQFVPKPDAADIQQAADNLGIKLPNAILTENPTYQKMESGLAQSPTIPAKPIRETYENFWKGIQDAGSKIEDLKTPESDFSLGSKLKSDIGTQVDAKSAPVTEMYQNLTPQLQKIKVNPQVVNTQFGALKRDPVFQTTQGKAILNDWKEATEQQPELNSLKELRSNVYGELGLNSPAIDNLRLDKINSALTKIRDNSIESTKLELPPELHPEVDNLRDQLVLADKAHASNVEDLNSIKGLVGNKSIGSPSHFANKLADTKEGDLAQSAANLDVGSMRSLQQQMPSVFEKAKQAKINDMVQNSQNAISGFSDAKFFKQYSSLDNEMKDLLFTPEQRTHIESLQTLRQAMPAKLGPSGTPEGLSYMADIGAQLKNTATDYIKKQALQRPSEIPEALKPTNVPLLPAAMQVYHGMNTPAPKSKKMSDYRGKQ